MVRSIGAIKSLRRLRQRRRYVAENGGNGAGKNRHGAKGQDIEIEVPVGTVVGRVDEGKSEAVDLSVEGMSIVVARGGRGGRGNARFVSSTNRFPVLAEGGDPGESCVLGLELKLFADVGIVGAPNAGKSSLLAALTGAHPKVASYPFTTIAPSLGTAEIGYDSIVIVDIPGLIEGAHAGVGLGHDFLRHVQRTKVLIHLIDGDRPDPVAEYHRIRTELELFDKRLASRTEIVAVNKVDLDGVEERAARLQQELPGREVLRISALARIGLGGLLGEVARALEPTPGDRATAAAEPPAPVIRPRPAERETRVIRDGEAYVVPVRAAERIAALVDAGDWEARTQFMEQLRRMGIMSALEKAGAGAWDVVRIGKLELEWD
jgi:GTP-binding protein